MPENNAARQFGPKAIACLELADTFRRTNFEGWYEKYEKICKAFSEKAVISKMEELAERGYLDYGVSARMGWLTEKGEEALRQIRLNNPRQGSS